METPALLTSKPIAFIALMIAVAASSATAESASADFPPADANYHNFAEMTAEVNRAVNDHPSLMTSVSLGTSFEGRQLVAAKISDNPHVDEAEPEVLFTANQGSREHLTAEMAL